MSDPTSSTSGPADWAARLGWLFVGSYSIGLLARKIHETLRGYPQPVQADLLDPSHVIYGAIMIAFSVVAWLTLLAMITRQPVKEIATWWQNVVVKPSGAAGTPKGIGKGVLVSIRWLSTVLTYIGPYWIVTLFLAYAVTGGERRDMWWVCGFFLAVPLVWWLRYFLESTGRVAVEKDLVSPHLAAVVGLPRESHSDFQGVYIVLLPAALAGIMFYARIAMPFGGGRPSPVTIFLSKDADTIGTQALRAIHGRATFLLPSSKDYITILRDTAAPSAVLLVPQRLITAVSGKSSLGIR